jgi:hypothetical protein
VQHECGVGSLCKTLQYKSCTLFGREMQAGHDLSASRQLSGASDRHIHVRIATNRGEKYGLDNFLRGDNHTIGVGIQVVTTIEFNTAKKQWHILFTASDRDVFS